MTEDAREIALAVTRRYSEIVTGSAENIDVAALTQAVDDVTLKTYIVEQTEQFRIRARSEEEALEILTDDSDPEHVEWLSCTNRSVTG